MGGGMGSGMPGGMFGGVGGGGVPGGFAGGDLFGEANARKKRGPSQDVVSYPMTLEDLYAGGVKKMRVTRKVNAADTARTAQFVDQSRGGTGSAMMREVSEIIEFEVKPGWRAGTKLTFAGKGDEVPGSPGRANDLVVVIEQKPHVRGRAFRRRERRVPENRHRGAESGVQKRLQRVTREGASHERGESRARRRHERDR